MVGIGKKCRLMIFEENCFLWLNEYSFNFLSDMKINLWTGED